MKNSKFLVSVFKKHELLLRKNFETEADYNRALTRLASAVTINDGTEQDVSKPRRWTLQFDFNDQQKWLLVLTELRDIANRNVQAIVQTRFDNLIASALQKREFDLEDLNAEIDVALYSMTGRS